MEIFVTQKFFKFFNFFSDKSSGFDSIRISISSHFQKFFLKISKISQIYFSSTPDGVHHQK